MPEQTEHEVTRLLQDWSRGEESARDRLVPLVETELRQLARHQMARERAEHTLQPTALVNEAFLRLTHNSDVDFRSRAQFFGLAAKVMRNILIDYARNRSRQKRGRDIARVPLDELKVVAPEHSDQLIELDEALERLATIDARKAKVVELRFFGGLPVDHTAAALGVSENTVIRDWAFAKAWLRQQLE